MDLSPFGRPTAFGMLQIHILVRILMSVVSEIILAVPKWSKPIVNVSPEYVQVCSSMFKYVQSMFEYVQQRYMTLGDRILTQES